MRASHRLGAAVVALVAVVALAGCLKMDGDLTVNADDTVEGTFVVGVNRQLLALTGQDAASITEQIQRDVASDPPTQGEYSSEPYEDDTFVGARLIFSGVPLEEFDAPGSEGERRLTITRDGDEYRVSGELEFDLGDAPSGPNAPNLAAMMEEAEPELRIAISFPGRVTRANGDIDGCTVTWEPTLTEVTTFEATANDAGSCNESISWWAWILIGLGVLVVIAGVVAIVRTLRSEKERRPPDRPSPRAAPAGFGPPAAPQDEDLPPESTPLTLPPPGPADTGRLPPPTPRPDPGFPPPEPKG